MQSQRFFLTWEVLWVILSYLGVAQLSVAKAYGCRYRWRTENLANEFLSFASGVLFYVYSMCWSNKHKNKRVFKKFSGVLWKIGTHLYEGGKEILKLRSEEWISVNRVTRRLQWKVRREGTESILDIMEFENLKHSGFSARKSWHMT